MYNFNWCKQLKKVFISKKQSEYTFAVSFSNKYFSINSKIELYILKVKNLQVSHKLSPNLQEQLRLIF